MEVTDELIDHLSELARLKFDEHEKEEIKKDLQRMISFVDKLNELDTAGISPLLHMTDAKNVFRDDVPGGSVSRKEALKNAPNTDGVYFKVPRVINNPSR